MRADGNADGNGDASDGNAPAKNRKSKTDERIEEREMGEKPVTIGVAVASSSFCHLLCYIVKYV